MKIHQIVKANVKRRHGGRKILSEKCVLFAQKLYARGFTMREVAARLSISLGSVHNILSDKHTNPKVG